MALVVGGCSETLPLHGDVTFTLEERAADERGAAFLSSHAGADAIAIVWDAPHMSMQDCETLTIVRGDGNTCAGTSYGLGCIVLSPRDGCDLDGLSAHEFGHYRRLGHIDHGLMQEFDPVITWSDDDQAECIRANACAR